MLAIVDYGVGNLYSLSSALKALSVQHCIAKTPEELHMADRIILPGVGAFADAARKLRQSGMQEALVEDVGAGKPVLGICLGMQMLFEASYEYGRHEGLGLIPGEVCPLIDDIEPGLKVPHIGWNRLDIVKDDPLFRYFETGRYVYYVHSYYAKRCREYTLATSDYSIPVTGAVRNGSVYGTQFHPEKSGEAGLMLLKAFVEI
ncbi:MAG: imidazole glycerol phosphate synthase subunit HisH [Clostridia bacterium]|nr:imidazole glycerol phosphate synthase subunit HisH [Clostridia bacterium]